MAINCVVLLSLFSLLLISGVNSDEDEKQFGTFHKSDNSGICNKEKIRGMCMAYFPRWYYNRNWNNCTEFIYGGCHGNGNNFESKEECENKCLVHANHKQSSTDDQENQEGPCIAALKLEVKKKMLKDSIMAIMVKDVPKFRTKHMLSCDEEGYYAPMQCLSDKSKCWCVDRLGKKIENSREKPTRGKPNDLDCSDKES